MAALLNPKHEAVAQGIFAGKSQGDAYREAGYKAKSPEKKVWDLLQQHPEIKGRVDELIVQKAEMERKAVELAAAASSTSRAYVMERLHEVAERCMQHYPVLNQKGEQVYVEVPGQEGETMKLVPAFTFDAKGAVRALHLLGLEHGMFAQRLKLEKTTPFDNLPGPVLKQIYEALVVMATQRGRVFEHDRPLGLSQRPEVDTPTPA